MEKISFFYPVGKNIGLGHQRRCQAIADYLLHHKLMRVHFGKLVSSTSVAIFDFPSQQNVSKIMSKARLPDGQVKSQKSKVKMVLIDNISPARLLADINIYPISHFSPNTLDWKNYQGKIYAGAKYFPLNQEFLKLRDKKLTLHSYNRKSKKSILITFGASDFKNLTPKIIKVLLPIPNIEIHAVIGPFFKKQSLSLSWPNNVIIHQNTPNIASLMAKSTIVITAFGITCYELAYLGIPTLIIYNFQKDEQDAFNFRKFGTCKVLGYHRTINPLMIRNAIKTLLSGPQKLKKMSQASKELIDGNGTQRITRIIHNLLKE